jgi:serine/threonine protein kinase
MNSASIQDQIQALGRGEMDVSTLVGHLREMLGQPDVAPDELLAELEVAHRDDTITTTDYTRLTQVIIENTQAALEDESGAIGNTVLVEADTDLEPQDERTSIAPSTNQPAAAAQAGGSSDAIDIGARLRDRFILDEVLGVGGMGTVYKGRDALKLEAQDRNPFIAVKILNDRFKQHPEAFIAFQREASRQQRLAHPNIATVYEFHRDGGLMYITMEYLDGRTLDEVIKDDARPAGGLPVERALTIIEDLCAALSHAHGKSIVHADFKPGNCFLTQNDHVKVLDFGIARAMKDPNAAAGDETLFDPRTIGALTPAYASPEMLEGVEDADPRDDIYGLACVAYELLTGRHPFGRVPGDQAKLNGLTPKRIKKISRRQNEALKKALAFERSDRTASVRDFIEELKPDGSRGSLLLPIGAVAVLAVLVIGFLSVPTYLDDVAFESVVADLSSTEVSRIEAAVTTMDDMDADLRARILSAGATTLIANVESQFQAAMNLPDTEVLFPEVGRMLNLGLALYPDSNRLVGLKDTFDQRQSTYLASLASLFEEYLVPARLLPDPDADDLHDLLERLRTVDPGNGLLADERIQAAYALAVEGRLAVQDYTAARNYLEAGLALATADPTLSDLRDRLDVIEQQMALSRTIGELEEELNQRVADVRQMDDLLELMPVIDGLQRVDRASESIPNAGAALAQRLSGQLTALYDAPDLATLTGFSTRYDAVWAALQQASIPEAVAASRLALVERQDALVAAVQVLIGTPDMTGADGATALDLIDQLRVIDPQDGRADELVGAIAEERLQRAARLAESELWVDARAELAAAQALALPALLIDEIGRVSDSIDAAELSAQRRAAEQQRVAQLQEEQERSALAAAQQQAEQERQRQAELARRAEVDAAATALAAAVSGFDLSAPEAAVRRAQARMATLERLESGHQELQRARAELPRLGATSVRLMEDTDRALTTLAVLTQLLGSNPELSKLQTDLEVEQARESEALRLARIVEVRSAISAALGEPAGLEQAEVRRRIDRDLATLGELAGGDSEALGEARQEYVESFVSAAGPLIGAKRFSLARELIEAAARQDGGSVAVRTARAELVEAESTYREERALQQRTARLLALRQRFELELGSGQLSRAEQTLAEFRDLDDRDTFGRTLAPRALADAYLGRASGALTAEDFELVRASLARAESFSADAAAVARIRKQLSSAMLETTVVAWFSGSMEGDPSEVRSAIERLRAMEGDGFGSLQSQWSALASGHLAGLAAEPERYNALSLLPESPELRALTPLEIATLGLGDLLGSWCDPNVRVEFEESSMRFVATNLDEAYPVQDYQVLDEEIRVRWEQARGRTIEFEFGRFSESGDRMVQLRGRELGDSNWQTYNRSFSRCQ